jgi:hypothetical protein
MRELLRVSTNADLEANKEPVRWCASGPRISFSPASSTLLGWEGVVA